MYNLECRISSSFFCHAICVAFCILCVCFSACQKIDVEEHAIHVCAPMSEGISSAVSFVVGDKAYVFGGRNQNGDYQNVLWEYDLVTDQWKSLGATPLVARVNATACVVNDTVYIGLGYTGGGIYKEKPYLKDFWQFVPSTNEWIRLADYPNSNTDKCVTFATDDALYIGCGFAYYFALDMCRFDLKTKAWSMMPKNEDKRIIAMMGMSGAQVNNRCFVGNGYTTTRPNYWYEYDIKTGGFTHRESIPGKARCCAAATAKGEYVYIIGGQHFGGSETSQIFYDEIQRYNPTTDSWTLCGHIPSGGVQNLVAFTWKNRVYFGLGEDKNLTAQSGLYYIE